MFFLFFIISFSPVKASIEFQTDYKITYQIGARGDGTVNQSITLTNKFSNIYPKEYYLQINGAKIQNISAEDGLGNILDSISESEKQTKIRLKFNQEIAGKGKILSFRISYSLPQFANKKGQIWEISIPRLANLQEIETLSLTIKAPLSFGKLSYSSISPLGQETTTENRIFSYQKSQLSQKPLVLAFGEFQIFDFSLNFFLKNQQERAIKTGIPIPPDTPYQSVVLTKIEPRPDKIRIDDDLNWIAEYQLAAGEMKEILVEGQAKISSRPENSTLIEMSKEQNSIIYLHEDRFWPVNNPLIKKLAQKQHGAKEIYNFVINHLEYDYQTIAAPQRQGALKAYQKKLGVCTEFSDLFVTLCRSVGIPARELEGFAFTNNQQLISLAATNDVLHSWPEYWDNKKRFWIQVDPTWAKTTKGMDFLNNFDLGHFVFVTHGKSSSNPAPPGSYKLDSNQKNVTVKFANHLISRPETKFTPQLKSTSKTTKIIIKNDSLAAAYNTQLNLLGWQQKNESQTKISYLPPLGEKEIIIKHPSIFSLIFGQPVYQLKINNSHFKLLYPKFKLNLRNFFAKLVGR